jgi:hypothetical protein
VAVVFEWRGTFDNAELNPLHAEAFDYRLLEDNWCSTRGRS